MTLNFRDRFPEAANGHFRAAHGYTLSSIGLGTYLGNWDEAKDAAYVDAIVRFVELGGNVIDTAANYRFQRSERSIGAALKALAEKGFGRDELFISTKAGFLPFDGEPPRDVNVYFEENFVKTGIARFEDLAGGGHCMTPDYLEHQIEQSRRNMGIDSIDLFYIHNPESQLSSVDKYMFEARLARSFERLEEIRSTGRIKYYGVATWNGFRVAPDNQSYHSMERMIGIARQVAGDEHGFKFIQLPHNLAMPEAYLLPNQAVNGSVRTSFGAAAELGLTAMTSASILQGKLTHSVPFQIRETLGNPLTDALAAIEFVRSTPGVTTALVGMSRVSHVEENMKLATVEPIEESRFAGLFEVE